MAERAVEIVVRMNQEEGFPAEVRRKAAARKPAVVLPEGEDPRTVAAACVLKELGLARPVLLGAPARVRALLGEEGADPGAFEIIDPAADERAERVAARLFERRRHKGLSQGEAHVLARQPLQLGAGMTALGLVDCMVAGAVHATGDVIRAGLYNAGLAEGIQVVSGCFVMVPPPGHPVVDRPLLFADSAVVPEPTEEQLVSIGLSSATTYRRLLGREPRVACLSFSTKGSAEHPAAERMARVAQALRAAGLQADGELQLDSALVASVGERKCPGSPVAGRADVLLFPDLQSGNIGYKMAQRLGGFQAIGPIVQGLARPIFDLSRGATAADIVNTVALAALCGAEE